MPPRSHFRINDPPLRPPAIYDDGSWGSNPIYIQQSRGVFDTRDQVQSWYDWMYLGDECLRDLYEEIGKYLVKKDRRA